MNPKDDELVDLIAKCAIRDQAALKILYQRIGGYLNSVAYRILKSDDIANEVLQEAFLQIWENAGTYRPHKAKPLTWMTSIVRYRSLDRLDKEKRHRNKYENDDDEDILSNIASKDADSPEAKTESQRLSAHIDTCLAALSDNICTSIRLAYIEGYSREEIAARFNTNANTVKSWLRRGSERLKKCLEAKIQLTQ